jgi:CRISPR-associated endonuclease/helicase Cas3
MAHGVRSRGECWCIRVQSKPSEKPSLPSLRRFQEQVGSHKGDAFLEIPTGAGKTVAAIRWALQNRLAGERIFYLLPYQASIEAMAKNAGRLFRC